MPIVPSRRRELDAMSYASHTSHPFCCSCRPAQLPLSVPSSAPVNVNGNVPPLPLIEPHHAQQASRRVPDEYRNPDIDRIEPARALHEVANAERHDDL